MHKLILSLMVAGAVAVATSAPAQAKSAGGVPIDNVVAFSPAANFMSIPGYVRYRIYLRDGRWLSRTEAIKLVDNAS